ncbi:MAG TPA: TlpA disulfide reductase family protein [Candidatus Acidoferrales bacterium]|nr:TlpA disulfide reductase family protein [Candidatus Acidoferrales bacterium]
MYNSAGLQADWASSTDLPCEVLDVRSGGVFAGVAVVLIPGLLFAGKSFTSCPGGVANVGSYEDRFNGKPAPEFELRLLGSKGKTLKLSGLRGKAVVVNFWATWCEPCRIEMPWLVELQKKYGPQGLQVIGVAMDDSGEKSISSFAHKMGVNYPILIGTEKVADLYGGIDGLPTLFFIDRSGKILEHELGVRGRNVIEENIKKSLDSKAAPAQ